MSPPEISVVVPFFNEEAAAFAVVDELGRELSRATLAWEGILVDDGSRDGTAAELRRACEAWPGCRLLQLPENRGQGPALFEGIRAAAAPVIAMMDGDGQNVPADILRLAPLLRDYDLVVGIRAERRDSRGRRLTSRIANALRSRALGDHVSDAGCALKVFKREVAQVFFPLKMLNPFMPALAVAGGFRVGETAVRHRERSTGRSKYGARALFVRPVIDFWTVWRRTRGRS